MAYTIRKYKASDKKQVEQLMQELDTYRENNYAARNKLFHKKKRADVVSLNSYTKTSIFVAEHDLKIVGYIIGSLRARKEYLLGRSGDIEELYVDAKARKGGVGKMLFATLIEAFGKKGCDHVFAVTDAENILSRSFYKSVGLHETTVEYWMNLKKI